MKVISFCNNKGGTGKTTLSTNIAFALSQHSKVLLIDLDGQTSVSTVYGLEESEKTILDVIEEPASINECITVFSESLHIIQAHSSMDLVAGEMEKLETPYNRIEQALKHVKYDYVLFDCPPSLNFYVGNAVMASDTILIVSLADLLSVKGIFKTINEVSSINKDATMKIVINQHKQGKLSGDMTVLIREFGKENNYKLIGTIPVSLNISNAVAYEALPMLATKYPKNNAAAKALIELSEKFSLN